MVAVLSADHWTVTVPVFGAYVVGAVVCTRSALFGAARMRKIRTVQATIMIVLVLAYLGRFVGILDRNTFTLALRATAIPSVVSAFIWPILKTDRLAKPIDSWTEGWSSTQREVERVVREVEDACSSDR